LSPPVFVLLGDAERGPKLQFKVSRQRSADWSSGSCVSAARSKFQPSERHASNGMPKQTSKPSGVLSVAMRQDCPFALSIAHSPSPMT
jgi:hypothetical protein